MLRFEGLILALALILLGTARAEGPVCVPVNGVACLVDEGGNAILDGFEDAFTVRDGALYAAGKRGNYRLYDAAGNALGDAAFAMVYDAGDCLIFRQGNLYGAMDDTGAVILPPEWTQLVSDGEGGFLALASDPLDETSDEILRVDAMGETTPTGVHTNIAFSPLRSGRMAVRAANGRYGAVNQRGELVVPKRWMGLSAFEDGLAIATGDAGVGLIDAHGREVVAAVYDWIDRGDGIIAVLSEDRVDVYAADGATLLYSVEGENLEAAVADGCLLVRDGDASKLYDQSGSVIGEFGPSFGCAPGLNGQLIAWEGEWGEPRAWLMDPDGDAASERFQHIVPLAGGRYAFATMKGVAYRSAELGRVQTSWDYDSLRFGLMDSEGRELLPAEYREIRALGEDRLLLVSDVEVRLTDLDGNAIKTWVTTEAEAATGE